MKKLALAFVLLVLLTFTLGVSATPETTVDVATQENESVPTETSTQVEVEAVETAEPAICLASTAMFPGPNYCGDPCSEEGQTTGCIDTSGPFWKRVICTCVNGSLVC